MPPAPAFTGPLLLVTAAPAESRAVAAGLGVEPPGADWRPVRAGEGVWLLQSGVGKVNAAAAVLAALPDVRPGAVVNLGICGSLPSPRGGEPLALGTAVLATTSVYADEGVKTPAGFLDLAGLGFPIGGTAFEGSAIPGDPALLAHLERLPEAGPLAKGPVATVSTCSGMDGLAWEVARRTGAIAEAMEGAAIAHALARLPAPRPAFAELRVVSNTTGDRPLQTWDMKLALATLTRLAAALR
jgi:futalosine hydrolase